MEKWWESGGKVVEKWWRSGGDVVFFVHAFFCWQCMLRVCVLDLFLKILFWSDSGLLDRAHEMLPNGIGFVEIFF